MKTQYEQHYNAAALKEMGVPVMKSLKKKHYDVLENWLAEDNRVEVDYPDITAEMVKTVVQESMKILKKELLQGSM